MDNIVIGNDHFIEGNMMEVATVCEVHDTHLAVATNSKMHSPPTICEETNVLEVESDVFCAVDANSISDILYSGGDTNARILLQETGDDDEDVSAYASVLREDSSKMEGNFASTSGSARSRGRHFDHVAPEYFPPDVPVGQLVRHLDSRELEQDVETDAAEEIDGEVKMAAARNTCHRLKKKRKKLNSKPLLTDRTCFECNKVLQCPSHLRSHIESVHRKLKRFECRICGKRYGKSYHVTHHINSVHFKKKQYYCEICGEGFFYVNTRTLHMMNVHGMEKHQCPYCDHLFTQRAKMAQHVRAYHTGQKEHSCPDCHKRYLTAHNLKMHVKQVHLGERPFSCQFCQKTYKQASDLKRHVSRLHSNSLHLGDDMTSPPPSRRGRGRGRRRGRPPSRTGSGGQRHDDVSYSSSDSDDDVIPRIASSPRGWGPRGRARSRGAAGISRSYYRERSPSEGILPQAGKPPSDSEDGGESDF